MIPHNPYRGRGGRGRGSNIIAQHGNRRLIVVNIASSSENLPINLNDPDYQEFLDYKKKQAGKNISTAPSYASTLNEEETEDSYVQEFRTTREVILLLEINDLKWKETPWVLMSSYLDIASYTAESYKQRSYYENILKKLFPLNISEKRIIGNNFFTNNSFFTNI